MDELLKEAEHLQNGKTLMWTPDEKIETKQADLTIRIDHHGFSVHRHVLEASSDYFRAMFSSGMKESGREEITLKLLQPASFQTIVEGFYSGKLDLNEDNVFHVTEAAHLLQLVPSLFSQCSEFLRLMINTESCFEVMYFCDSMQLVDIYSDARRYCLANFSNLRHSQCFLDLTLQQLFNYLSDKHLVVMEEMDVVDALKDWLFYNDQIKRAMPVDKTRKLVQSCVWLKDFDKSIDLITSFVLGERTSDIPREEVKGILKRRERKEDIFMFWSLLDSTTADGLVDVVRLCQDTGQGTRFDSMTSVVDNPGYDLGSAFCTNEFFVYLSGGGPNFGKVNWIRKIYRFDLSKSSSRWEAAGELYETRRHHAMVAVGAKLYIFGGFGKFRTKNVKLDCFDTLSGTWEVLPVTPTHEIKPVATSYKDCVLYMDRNYTVHCFNTVTGNWCSLITLSPAPSPGTYALPLSIFVQENGTLLVLLNGQDVFTLIRIELQNCDGGLECKSTHKLQLEKHGHYEGSGLANGKLLILLGGGGDGEEDGGGFEQFSPVRQILTYCLERQTIISVADTNVRKALTVLTAPYLPSSFPTGSLEVFP